MFKKKNIKILVIVFVLLLVIVVIIKISDARRGESSFAREIETIDTSKLMSVTILPLHRAEGDYTLYKKNKEWYVKKGNREFMADEWSVKTISTELANLDPERVVSQSKASWKDFQVDDSLAVVLTINQGKRQKSKIYIGKYTYQQPVNAYQRQGKIFTYIRFGGSDNVYAVEGFLHFIFNKSFDNMRSKKLIPENEDQWSKLCFYYPDSSFTLDKENDKWVVDGHHVADSSKIEKYLQTISGIQCRSIADSLTCAQDCTYKLVIETKGLNETIDIKAFKEDSSSYVFTSSYNKDTKLYDVNADLCRKIFVGGKEFHK